ncbi:glycine zipper domain-containing protein [Legionella impletisoli]|uniref:Glycine zipper domain-containing protein n=1 Tax=Legionella impletisoli TaxID=343510 RepID=A0A917JRD6_9GAMM|nr:glycine zipper domain-containing protein [Legionella impletisoli]GGI81678.1 hypothetical protein GCM10007966_07720 [Legionella impletisoli]
MKKLILSIFAISALSAGLIGCGTRGEVGATGGAAAGAGVGLAATGTPLGAAVGAGVGALVGKEATDRDVVIYRKKGVVYHDGVAYHIHNGRYVLVR